MNQTEAIEKIKKVIIESFPDAHRVEIDAEVSKIGQPTCFDIKITYKNFSWGNDQ